jgi:predicted CopG family antitoxin
MDRTHKLTTISVSQKNYLALKKLGNAGESFNDVITAVLKKVKMQPQSEIRDSA